MKSLGSHGNLTLLFMMKVMVRHFVSDFHNVNMITFIIMLTSNQCEVFFLQFHSYVSCWRSKLFLTI
jgi:hypothetical protein